MALSGEKKIWLIDDDPDDQYMVSKILTSLNPNIKLRCFDCGKTFLAQLKLDKPDLVLLDLNMPIMSGMDVLEQLQNWSNWQAMPIVVYSTSQSELDIDEAYRKGAKSFLSKAGSYSRLKTQIEALYKYWLETVKLPKL